MLTAKVVYKVANAIITLQNYGIAHRNIRPSKVLVNLKPWCEVKLSGFNYMSSYLDHGKFPPVKRTDYNPPDADWAAGSKEWDIFSLSMIILEWHLRKVEVIKAHAN
jgi:hypothetical protein